MGSPRRHGVLAVFLSALAGVGIGTIALQGLAVMVLGHGVAQSALGRSLADGLALAGLSLASATIALLVGRSRPAAVAVALPHWADRPTSPTPMSPSSTTPRPASVLARAA